MITHRSLVRSIDLPRFGELGKKGVLALMADSTNVERPGYTPSEKTIGKVFDHLFDDNKDHRIIIATFASNVDRVQQIINLRTSMAERLLSRDEAW